MKLPEKVTLAVTDIHPYEKNPRVITDEAVEAVKTSIDSYGYVQPLIVDADNVIISGHTRFEALKALGIEKVEVYRADLPKKEADKFRLVDNKTNELSDWAHDKLVAELREFEDSVLTQYFPDTSLEVGSLKEEGVTDRDILAGIEKAQYVAPQPQVHMKGVECPDCKNVFQVKTSTLPGVKPEDLWE